MTLWLAPAFGAQCLAYVAYAFALQGTARVDGGPRLGFRLAMRVVAAGFGAWFARSSKGGFELDYRALRGAGARRQEALSRVLYTDYLLLFQMSGIVLLVAMMGAIVLTLRSRPSVKRQNIAEQTGRKRKDAVELKDVRPGQGL